MKKVRLYMTQNGLGLTKPILVSIYRTLRGTGFPNLLIVGISIYLFCFCCITQINAQIKFDLLLGNAAPLHELNNSSLSPTDINTYSANLTFVPKNIGASFQFMHSKYKTNEEFLNQFQSFNPSYNLDREFWNSSFVFLGPVLKLGKEKINLELFPKIGMGFIKEARREVLYTSPVGTEHTLYTDNNDELSLEGNSLFSGLDARLNIGVTKNFGFTLAGGFITNRLFGNGNSTIYREVNQSGNGVTEQELTTGRLLQLDCEAYDLLHVSVGVSLKIPKKNKEPKPDGKIMLPPKPVFPEDQSKISQAEADSLVLEWIKETPNVDKANYQFYLYKKEEKGRKDSLIFNTKVIRNTNLELPEKINLKSGLTYVWKVQAVDDKDLIPCPDQCNSITYEFEVVGLAIPQYYQLSSKNAGNHVLVQDRLRFVIGKNILMAENVTLEIFDGQDKLVEAFENLDDPNGQIQYQGFDRYEVDIRGLKSDEYFYLKVANEDRTYFLRFYKNEIENVEKK